MTQTPVQSLQGQFLLAMPSMGDPRFLRSVIYMVAHDSEGAMGFIINKRAEGLSLGDILKDMPETVAKTGLVNLPVYVGGPVQNDRGFVLHTSDYEKTHNTLSQELPIALTQSADVLVDAAHGRGPEKMRLFLGYAGWGPARLRENCKIMRGWYAMQISPRFSHREATTCMKNAWPAWALTWPCSAVKGARLSRLYLFAPALRLIRGAGRVQKWRPETRTRMSQPAELRKYHC